MYNFYNDLYLYVFVLYMNAYEHCWLLSVCQDKSAQKEDASCAEAATAIVDGHCEDAPALATEAEESTRDADHVNPGLAFGLSNDDRAKEVDVDHDDNHGLMFGLNTEDHVKETDVDHGLGSFSCQPSAKSFYAETSAYSQPQLDSPLSDSSSSVCVSILQCFLFCLRESLQNF